MCHTRYGTVRVPPPIPSNADKAPITTPLGGGYKSLNVTIRKTFGLYANVRPIKLYPGVQHRIHGGHKQIWEPGKVDLVIIRENTEGPYVGVGGAMRVGTPNEVATQNSINTRLGVERVMVDAFERAAARSGRATRPGRATRHVRSTQ